MGRGDDGSQPRKVKIFGRIERTKKMINSTVAASTNNQESIQVRATTRKLTVLIILAAACGMLTVFGLVSSAVFANRATKLWYDYDYRYPRAYRDALAQFKKNHPRSNPTAGHALDQIKNTAKARMWNSKYDPPGGGRNQGTANVCGVLGIIGLGAFVACFVVIWKVKKKRDVKDTGEQDHSEGPQDSLDKIGVTEKGVRVSHASFFKSVRQTCTQAFVVPQVAFLILGLLFGMIMLVVNPPFQAMDEHAHFARAYSIAEGHIIPIVKHGESSFHLAVGVGADLPSSIAFTHERTKFWPPQQKRKVSDITSAMNIPLGSKHSNFTDFSPFGSTIAPPMTYLPQSLGVALGRLFHLSPLLLMYLGRFFNLMFFLIIVSLAITITPIIKWTFFLLGLMPLTVNLSASLSYDSPLIAICFLVIAYILYLALDPRKESIARKDIYILLMLAVLITLVKQPYFLILFAFLIIPSNRFKSRKQYFLVFATIIGAAFLVTGVWSVLLRSTNQLQTIGGAAKPQLRATLSNPFEMLRVFLATFNAWKEKWLVQVVGGLGWFQVILPTWFAYAYLFSTASVTALDKENIVFRAKQKAIAIGVALLVTSAILTIIYISATPVGQPVIQSVNPRYFIPVLPFIFLIFYNTSIRYEKGRYFYIFLLCITLLSILITMTKIVGYYY